jgi:hypothetical protein
MSAAEDLQELKNDDTIFFGRPYLPKLCSCHKSAACFVKIRAP